MTRRTGKCIQAIHDDKSRVKCTKMTYHRTWEHEFYSIIKACIYSTRQELYQSASNVNTVTRPMAQERTQILKAKTRKQRKSMQRGGWYGGGLLGTTALMTFSLERDPRSPPLVCIYPKILPSTSNNPNHLCSSPTNNDSYGASSLEPLNLIFLLMRRL